jgi:hypothetical protein
MNTGKQQHAASMLPSTFVEGGLWDDLDVEISDIAWSKFNFAKEGAPQNLKLALILELWPLSGLEAGQQPFQQAFSGGDLKYFVPSADDDGAYPIAVGDKSALNSNTNAAMFTISLFECATPEQAAWLANESGLASGNCKGLVGLKFHVKRMPQKERKGLSAQEGEQGPKSILLATNIIALPGETESVVPAEGAQAAAKPAAQVAKPASRATGATAAAPASRAAVGGKANGAAVTGRPASRTTQPTQPTQPTQTAGKPAAAAGGAGSGEWGPDAMNAKATEALGEMLNANEGMIEFAEVPKQAFRTEALRVCPPQVRQKICALMYDEQWIGAQEGVAYDAATGTVALA